jgi:hypothetical protein
LQAFDATAAAATLRADCIAVRVPYSSPAPGSIAAQEAAATADATDSEDSDASKEVTCQLLVAVMVAIDCSCSSNSSRSKSSGVSLYKRHARAQSRILFRDWNAKVGHSICDCFIVV